MITLRPEEMDKLGLSYVLDMLSLCSPYGKEHVRRLRFYTPTEREALEMEWRNIGIALRTFDACEAAFMRLQHIFMQLRDIRKTLNRLLEDTLSEVELFEVKRFLLQLSLIGSVYHEMGKPFEGITFTEEAQALALIDPDGKRSPTYFVYAEPGSALSEVRKQKNRIEDQLCSEISVIQREKLLEERRVWAAQEEKEAFLVRQNLSRALRPFSEALLVNTAMIGKLDFILQKAWLAKQWDAVMPCIVEGGLLFEGLVHPKLDHILNEQGGFTRISFAAPEGVAVITGANMGGKSVALRTLMLQVLLCQAGFFAFATRAELVLFDAVHIIAEDMENEARGLSSFGAEILHIQKMLADVQSGLHCFVSMDEPARGTNPEEGAVLVRALTRKLAKAHAVAVLATHYDGVADVAQVHYRVAGLTDLPAVLPEGSGIDVIARYMNYGLVRVDGDAKAPRDALTVCRLLGLDQDVLQDMEKALR